MHKFLKMAWKRALSHQFPENQGFRHCAVLASGSKLMAIGYNRSGWSSEQAYKYNTKKLDCCTVHADVDALLKLKNRDASKGATIYVIRVTRKGELAMSKPCPMCSMILKEHGVRKAVFSIDSDNNTFGVVDFR